jgi:hypothetical protein
MPISPREQGPFGASCVEASQRTDRSNGLRRSRDGRVSSREATPTTDETTAAALSSRVRGSRDPSKGTSPKCRTQQDAGLVTSRISLHVATRIERTEASTGAPLNSRLLVKFQPLTSAATVRSTVERVGGNDLRTITPLNVHVVSISSNQRATALDRIRKKAAAAYAEPDSRLAPQELLPNDPSFPQQFAIAGGAWEWYTTHTTSARDITKGDPSVVVAILDNGLKMQGLSDMTGGRHRLERLEELERHDLVSRQPWNLRRRCGRPRHRKREEQCRLLSCLQSMRVCVRCSGDSDDARRCSRIGGAVTQFEFPSGPSRPSFWSARS